MICLFFIFLFLVGPCTHKCLVNIYLNEDSDCKIIMNYCSGHSSLWACTMHCKVFTISGPCPLNAYSTLWSFQELKLHPPNFQHPFWGWWGCLCWCYPYGELQGWSNWRSLSKGCSACAKS